MCATYLNPLVNFEYISKYSLLLVSEFVIATLASGTKICILLGCEAAFLNPRYEIGFPVDIQGVGMIGDGKILTSRSNVIN